ncbi:MAG: transporter substrate-binding domain-containing protein [Bacteroidales bacterium]|nr:transporter substrate-binding domain-containing protein [Bacteroidales bacterium]
MKKHAFRLAALTLLLICVAVSCDKSESDAMEYPHDLFFFTENYAPFNFEKHGAVAGFVPELLEEIARKLKFNPQISLLPWSEAVSMLDDTPNGVLFSMVLNSERKDRYKWAGPFAALEYHFYKASSNALILSSLEEAKNVNAIGVVEGYSITDYLESQGFSNLVYVDSQQQGFDHLLDGEIDIFPSDRLSAQAALQASGHVYYNVRNILPIKTEFLYFAFNKKVPDEVVSDFQTAINSLKQSGFVSQLSRKYLNTSDIPGVLQIYTENYPPLTFMNDFGEITGFGTDIVREIMQRNSIYETIKLTTWSNAYNMALHNPNFCLFTMDRTAIRDTLFHWVGPIGTNDTHFYVRAGSEIIINSIEDAMALDAIGTVSSWFSDQYLRDLGFENLVSDGDPGMIVEWLMAGEVDAFVCSAITISEILQANDYTFEDVREEPFTLLSSDFYISFSKNTPGTTVDLWQETFEAMQADGTYDAIYEKWLAN